MLKEKKAHFIYQVLKMVFLTEGFGQPVVYAIIVNQAFFVHVTTLEDWSF